EIPSVRMAAAHLLGRLGDPEGVEALRASVTEEREEEVSGQCRKRCSFSSTNEEKRDPVAVRSGPGQPEGDRQLVCLPPSLPVFSVFFLFLAPRCSCP